MIGTTGWRWRGGTQTREEKFCRVHRHTRVDCVEKMGPTASTSLPILLAKEGAWCSGQGQGIRWVRVWVIYYLGESLCVFVYSNSFYCHHLMFAFFAWFVFLFRPNLMVRKQEQERKYENILTLLFFLLSGKLLELRLRPFPLFLLCDFCWKHYHISKSLPKKIA